MLCSIPSSPGIFLSRNYSALQHPVFFQESILSRNCSALQHPVFSRKLSIQELLCSAASRLFQESFYPVTILLCSILSLPGIFLSRNCSALQHPVFSRNLSIQELLCPLAFQLFHKSRRYRNLSALHHPVFSRNLFNPGTALLCSILSFPGIYSIQELLCSAASVYSRNIFHLGTVLLYSIPSITWIYSI